MGGGGKGPPDNSQMMMEERRLERERMDRQEETRRQELAREEARKAAEREQQMGASRQRVEAAYNAALQDANRRLQTRGLDASSGHGYGSDIMGLVRGALDRARAGAPEIVENASALFSPTKFDDAFNEVRSGRRNELGRGLDDFAGAGFEQQAFGMTAGDDILRAIIGEQHTDAQETLNRALARGQINEAGFGQAQTGLGRQQSGAMSRGQDMAGGVLQGYRNQLTGMAQGFRDRVNNYNLDNSINLDSKRQQLGDLTNNLRGRMDGDIMNAIGDYNFFDTNTLLGRAANRSGMQNNNTSPLVSSTSQPTNSNLVQSFEDDQSRMSGSTGAF
jgi:hypothetical protein